MYKKSFWLLAQLAMVAALPLHGWMSSGEPTVDPFCQEQECSCGHASCKLPRKPPPPKKVTKKIMEEQEVFGCTIDCMDGRVQDAVKNYMKEHYGVNWVDVITEPGPNKILAENTNRPIVENIKKRLEVSVKRHGAKIVTIVGHEECAGNPVGKEEQIAHLKKAKKTVEGFGLGVKVVLLWVGKGWKKAELVG